MTSHPFLRAAVRGAIALAVLLGAAAFALAAAKPAAKASSPWTPTVSPEEMELQRQVREIALTLRAPCCPELTLAQHDSPVTLEMKKQIHDMLQQGKSRRQIVSALHEKYGDAIYPKSIASSTLLLYGGVPALALILVWVVWRQIARRRRPEVLHLDDDRWGKDGRKAA